MGSHGSAEVVKREATTAGERPMLPPLPSDKNKNGEFLPWTLSGAPQEQNFRMDGIMQPIKFGRVTNKEEWDLIERLHEVRQPASVGTGNDVKFRWPEGPGDPQMKVLAVWKLSGSEVLEMYMKEVEVVEQKRGESCFVPTITDELQRELLNNGLIAPNEYLMLHGTLPCNLKSILKTGLNNSVASQTSYNFGRGTYLADAADKCDQHLTPDEGLKHIRSIVGEDDQQLMSIVPGTGSESNMCISLVVRAALGKHMELQLAEELPLTKVKDNVGAKSDYHWKDPYTKRTEVVKVGEIGHNERVPPLPHYGEFSDFYDSVKVMCGKYNPEFQEGWSQRLTEDSPVTNAFPFRFNEYLVPFTTEPGKRPRVATQYLVLYERRRVQRST